MKLVLRKTVRSVSRAQAFWLTLLLVLAVLVPSLCLLWFMGQAVRNERLAVQQRLVEAYSGYLSLARDRLADSWDDAVEEIERQVGELPARMVFARQVRAGSAGAIVVLDDKHRTVYPEESGASASEEPGGDWLEARQLEARDPAAAAEVYASLAGQMTNTDEAAQALQGLARCLLQSGREAEAIAVLTERLMDERYEGATDRQNRWIVPNALLMALEFLNGSEPEQARVLAERLHGQLLDYEAVSMPAGQRRFLMQEVQGHVPSEAISKMLAAEELAAACADSSELELRTTGLQAGPLPGVWQFVSSGGRVVMLFRGEDLVWRVGDLAAPQDLPDTVRLEVLPPGRESENALASLLAGPAFPGWRLAISPQDPQWLDTAARSRVTSYVWIGALVLGVVAVLAVLALGLVRRQTALTRLRNDLVANVTHELKTPLASMRLLVDTLLASPEPGRQTTREYLELIAKENLRLSRLIDNFLTFSRIERNRYTFDFRETPAGSIAASAVAAVPERFNMPGCQFEVRIPQSLPAVRADADAMVTALLNLLDNAYKYSDESKRITFSVGAGNGHVHFTVADNGIGLSPRDTKRVFTRFFQVNHHLSRGTGGAGLGLSIVQFIVTAHGGSVHADSELNRGSTFTVTLPVIQPAKETP